MGVSKEFVARKIFYRKLISHKITLLGAYSQNKQIVIIDELTP